MNDPRNLEQARSQIAALEAEIVKLKATPPQPVVVATSPTKATEIREVLIQQRTPKSIEEMSITELRVALNSTKNEARQHELYRAIKVKEAAARAPIDLRH